MDLVANRKAFHNYEILDTFEAGLILLGSEIKSLRNHGGNLQDAYVDIKNGELWLLHSTIAPYSHSGIFPHEEKRPRKLLMHKNEISKLERLHTQKGFVLVPIAIFLSKRGLAKLKFATARGKKTYDKRATLKEKAQKRDQERLD